MLSEINSVSTLKMKIHLKLVKIQSFITAHTGLIHLLYSGLHICNSEFVLIEAFRDFCFK